MASTQKKVPPKKLSKPGASAKALKAVTDAVALAEVASAADDPVGCCLWLDASGQNRHQEMTQSACKGKPSSTFRANKRCPTGGG
jgi:hypothetical protein